MRVRTAYDDMAGRSLEESTLLLTAKKKETKERSDLNRTQHRIGAFLLFEIHGRIVCLQPWRNPLNRTLCRWLEPSRFAFAAPNDS